MSYHASVNEFLAWLVSCSQDSFRTFDTNCHQFRAHTLGFAIQDGPHQDADVIRKEMKRRYDF